MCLAYVGWLGFKFTNLEKALHKGKTQQVSEEKEKSLNKIYSFSFSKYSNEGEKELEIEGDSADIFTNDIALKNVIAKAYADDAPITITSDEGVFNKSSGIVYLARQ